MGLDIYAGSLTRYYMGNWETIAQRAGREHGIEVTIDYAHPPDRAGMTDAGVREQVVAWRTQLNDALLKSSGVRLDWDESPGTPYFTDKPGWDRFGDLLLWAAREEHPQLRRRANRINDYHNDEAYRASNAVGFRTRYGQLLRDEELWFPVDFGHAFTAPDAGGNRIKMGSGVALLNELHELNGRTWKAAREDVREWRVSCFEDDSQEGGAKFAFAILFELAERALHHRLILKLDY